MRFWKYILILCFVLMGISTFTTKDIQAKNRTLKFAPKVGTYTYVMNYDNHKYNEQLIFKKSKYGISSTEESSPNEQFYNESSKKLSYSQAIGDFAFIAKYPLKTGQSVASGREYYSVKVRNMNKTIKTKAGIFKKAIILRSSLKGQTKNYIDYYLAPDRGIILEKNNDGIKLLELAKYNSKKKQNVIQAKRKKTRYSTTLKSSSGKQYKIKLVGIGDKTGIASWNSDKPYEMVWAGANEGDRIYHGDFQFYVNNKKSSQKIKNYTYNKTRQMVYKVSSKYKGQPDLLLISSTEASIYRSASVYYMYNGQLKQAKNGLGNTLRPKNIGKNKFKLAVYENSSDTTGYKIEYYQLDEKKGTLTNYKTDFIEGYTIKW